MDHHCRSARLLMAVVYAMACTTCAIVTVGTAAAQDVTTAVEAPNVAVLGTYVKADDARGTRRERNRRVEFRVLSN